MKEMILLFNPPAKEQLLKIRSALLPLHIRIPVSYTHLDVYKRQIYK